MSDGAVTPADLREAYREFERAQEQVDERGEADLEALAESHRRLRELFSTYEERATGDGDFAAFIEFQEEMAKFVADLPEDLPGRERFEDVDDRMQKRRLTESDFAAARETVSPLADDVALLEERDDARDRYRELRLRARRRLDDLDERIAELERVRRLGEADPHAPVERIREPIAAYNDAVREAFAAFRREASAREVLSFVASTAAFPLVPFERPPATLREYVETHEAGTEPIPRLLEYAGYSESKLSHYVADAGALKRAVGTNQTYLRRLDADPLVVAWPPPPADRLRWRLRELVQVTGRFAPEEVVARARDLRSVVEDPEYAALRESATARDQLTDEQRERLASGAVEADLAAAREAREDLADALAELPDV